jgi:hypothetical protein
LSVYFGREAKNNKYSKVLNFHTAKLLSVVFSHFKIKVFKMSEEKSSNVLKPGAIIRPFLSLETAIEIIENLYGLKAFGLKEYIRFTIVAKLAFKNFLLSRSFIHRSTRGVGEGRGERAPHEPPKKIFFKLAIKSNKIEKGTSLIFSQRQVHPSKECFTYYCASIGL